MSIDDLTRRCRQLETLTDLAALVTSSLDTREIRKRAIEAATTVADAEAGSLLLLDQETGELFFEVALGDHAAAIREIRLAPGQGIAGWVAQKGEAVIINDTQSDPRFFKGADAKSSFKTRNMICVPVRTKDRIIGVLQAINKNEGIFDELDRDGLAALANQVAVAIENATLYQDLKDAFHDTAAALAETIEKRDPYTGGHTQRVMKYSLAIGRMMGMSASEMEDLKLAAILHDIGKIGIRDNILLKNDRLDREETSIMNMHAQFGADILSHVKKLQNVIPGVRGHHEKLDGKGYPDGLSGDAVPLVARIIAVADTFDAMTTDRPYRKALSTETAVAELRKCAGTQFDAGLVEHFVRSLSEGSGDAA